MKCAISFISNIENKNSKKRHSQAVNISPVLSHFEITSDEKNLEINNIINHSVWNQCYLACNNRIKKI